MSITFVCTCGKRLRARNEMAARRTMCPACGRPVGVPSTQPTQRGTPAAPLTPEERRRRPRVHVPDDVAVVIPFLNNPLQPSISPPNTELGLLRFRAVELPCEDAPPQRHADPLPVRDPPPFRVVEVSSESMPPDPSRRLEDVREIRLRPRRGRRGYRRGAWPREKHWYQCLLYPFLSWKFLLGVSVALSLLTTVATLMAADAAPAPEDSFESAALAQLKWAPLLTVLLVILAFACSFFQWVLNSAVAGEGPQRGWPAGNPRLLLSGLTRWLACLLAGPVELAVLGFYYWMECGDPTLLDWIILAEVGILVIGCWLYTLTAVARSGRLVDANPLRAVELAHRLGGRGMLIVLGAFVTALVHGWLMLGAIERLHLPGRGLSGWLFLTWCCFSSLFCATFLLRLLGLWCFDEKTAGQAGEERRPLVD
jgi:hypothetical protein